MSPVADPAPSDRSARQSKLAAIAAIDIEAKSLANRKPGFEVVQSGPGPERAAAAAGMAIRRGATALLSFGLAGALERTVAPGCIVVPDRVLDDRGRELRATDRWRAALIECLSRSSDVRGGTLVSIGRVLVSPDDKTQAARRYGAVACDMESAAIGAAAEHAGVDFAAVRVIVDGLEDELPRDVAGFIDAAGRSRFGPLVRAASDPSQWRAICVIAMRFNRARKSLARVADACVPLDFLC